MKIYNKLAKAIFLASALGAVVTISGCAGIGTAISHKDLKIQTKMSNSIFLPPVPENKQVVFVQVRNTTAKESINLRPELVRDLRENGWRVTHDMNKAYVLLQVNVLQVGKTNPSALKDSLAQGYGAGIAGAMVGAVATDSMGGAVAGGLIAGLGEVIVDASVHNVTYSMVTDVQISVRAPKGVKIHEKVRSDLQQGTSTDVKQTYHQRSDWERYRTRVVSYANQVNLKFDKAAPILTDQLASSVANIL